MRLEFGLLGSYNTGATISDLHANQTIYQSAVYHSMYGEDGRVNQAHLAPCSVSEQLGAKVMPWEERMGSAGAQLRDDLGCMQTPA